MGALGRIDPRPPERLASHHNIVELDSGEPTLDTWLRRRALPNESSGASRTYVVCAGETVVAYYSLAVGGVAHAGSSGRLRRNMPDPVPVMILARLAVDRRFQGRGLGRALLRDAILRTLQAAEIAGIRGILVHAISDAAKRFYEFHGFTPSPIDPMTLVISTADAERSLR